FVELSHPNALAEVTSPAAETVTETSTKKIKCMVWDLDNTLWDGVLIEDGLSGIKLRSEVVEAIKALDQRGIVNSIASKNYPEEAEAALKAFGLDMFVFPEIGWGPKSASVRAIQRAMNVGMDTIAFVDDQPFERAEVTSACPEVEAFDIDAIAGLLQHPRLDVPVTADSGLRRKRYQEQAARNVIQEQSDDYLGFLRSCEISVDLAKLSQDMVPRAHELAQRTNQMNFSGNRYTIREIEALNGSDDAECWTIAAADRFGSYGVVGLAVIERDRNQITDLMMSCRIQKKMVDHAVLCEFLRRYHRPDQPLTIKYRPTERNRNAAGLFTELGFEADPLDDKTTLLSFPAASPLPTNDIVTLD
ncbi:MAG: HAD-IIIC family phosphatase, partial [Geminicoccaceae bacterium]